MEQPVTCERCGGPMQPGADGRLYGCGYCGQKRQVAVSAEQMAAGFALDLSNVDTFLQRLAEVLQEGFADHAQVQARGGRVESLEIDLASDVFHVQREGHRAVAQHKKVVRGIALKTQTLALDAWVERLLGALARTAEENGRAAWVLTQLGGSSPGGTG